MNRDEYFTESPIPVEPLEEGVRGEEGKSVVTLQGVVRRDREGVDELDHVVFEAELARAVEGISALCREVEDRWDGAVLLFRHRVGRVGAGETSVFIAVTAACREDALAACRFVMERVRALPGLLRRDVFRGGSSRLSHDTRETFLLSDDAFSLPQS